MGFRFRRSIRIMPGVRLNLGRRGTSVSVGVRGAHVTVGPSGVRQTVGVPGTGMSYTTNESWNARDRAESAPPRPVASSGSAGWVVAGILFIILLVVLAS